jgi:hypothetical protein
MNPENNQQTEEENRINKKVLKTYVAEYKKTFRHHLLTTRFNNSTWNENVTYRSRNTKIPCIYCSPEPITKIIPIDAIMFVLEMNNDTNKIIGIGMVRNHPYVNKYCVYSEGNYNRYVYVGKTRIGRENMTEEEERIMTVFDILCFTGNKHMKRGQGLKSFPTDMLYRCSVRLDLVQFIREMFKRRLSNIK